MADHRPPRPEFHDLELSALRSGHLTSWQEWQSWQERMAADPARAGEYLDFLLPHGMAVRITGLMGPLSRLNGQSARVLALHGVRVNVQLCTDAGSLSNVLVRPNNLQHIAPPTRSGAIRLPSPALVAAAETFVERRGSLATPLLRAAVAHLPLADTSALAGDANCAICQESLEAGCTAIDLPCCHLFHKDCLAQWLLHEDATSTNRSLCPSCRTSIFEEGHIIEEDPRVVSAVADWREAKNDDEAEEIAQQMRSELTSQAHPDDPEQHHVLLTAVLKADYHTARFLLLAQAHRPHQQLWPAHLLNSVSHVMATPNNREVVPTPALLRSTSRILDLLVAAGCDVHDEAHCGSNLLCHAAMDDKWAALIDICIEHGADIDHVCESGRCAVFCAVHSGETGECLDSLLRHGAKTEGENVLPPYVRDEFRFPSLLGLAVHERKPSLLRVLLSHLKERLQQTPRSDDEWQEIAEGLVPPRFFHATDDIEIIGPSDLLRRSRLARMHTRTYEGADEMRALLLLELGMPIATRVVPRWAIGHYHEVEASLDGRHVLISECMRSVPLYYDALLTGGAARDTIVELWTADDSKALFEAELKRQRAIHVAQPSFPMPFEFISAALVGDLPSMGWPRLTSCAVVQSRVFATRLHALHLLISSAPEESVARAAVRSWPGLLNVGDAYGRRPLHFAAAQGSAGLVGLLLDERACPMVRCSQYGATPLHLAASLGRSTCVARLLAHAKAASAEEGVLQLATSVDFVERTPLHYAVLGRDHECLSLLSHPKALHMYNLAGHTPLHALIEQHDDGQAVRILLNARADPSLATLCRYNRNVQERMNVAPNGFTALHMAAQGAVSSLLALLDANVLNIDMRRRCYFNDASCDGPVLRAPGGGYMVHCASKEVFVPFEAPRFGIGERVDVQLSEMSHAWTPCTVLAVCHPAPRSMPGAYVPYVISDDRPASGPTGRVAFSFGADRMRAANLVRLKLRVSANDGSVVCAIQTLPPSRFDLSWARPRVALGLKVSSLGVVSASFELKHRQIEYDEKPLSTPLDPMATKKACAIRLVKAGLDMDRAIQVAAGWGEVGCVELLLERGCTLELLNTKRLTGLLQGGRAWEDVRKTHARVASVLRACLHADDGDEVPSAEEEMKHHFGLPPRQITDETDDDDTESISEADTWSDHDDQEEEDGLTDRLGEPIVIKLPPSVLYQQMRAVLCRCCAIRDAASKPTFAREYRTIVALIARALARALEARHAILTEELPV